MERPGRSLRARERAGAARPARRPTPALLCRFPPATPSSPPAGRTIAAPRRDRARRRHPVTCRRVTRSRAGTRMESRPLLPPLAAQHHGKARRAPRRPPHWPAGAKPRPPEPPGGGRHPSVIRRFSRPLALGPCSTASTRHSLSSLGSGEKSPPRPPFISGVLGGIPEMAPPVAALPRWCPVGLNGPRALPSSLGPLLVLPCLRAPLSAVPVPQLPAGPRPGLPSIGRVCPARLALPCRTGVCVPPARSHSCKGLWFYRQRWLKFPGQPLALVLISTVSWLRGFGSLWPVAVAPLPASRLFLVSCSGWKLVERLETGERAYIFPNSGHLNYCPLPSSMAPGK